MTQNVSALIYSDEKKNKTTQNFVLSRQTSRAERLRAHSHVASESVQVVVGLLTFDDAVVLERVKITVLQGDNRQLINQEAAAAATSKQAAHFFSQHVEGARAA